MLANQITYLFFQPFFSFLAQFQNFELFHYFVATFGGCDRLGRSPQFIFHVDFGVSNSPFA